ncbi:MAG: flagellar motor protein MotB [Burkholderiales bacterium]|nr:flagellar motor protein MotB [Burkholderiales bacterium]MCE7877260.1 motility protein MotB [Betaproteobacteria bacterium PRO3]
MSGEERPIIVVRRVKKVAGGAHGAAWKIAYADFVTAMMAFFLLMWLLGSTTKADLNGIADYFKTPLKVALAGGSGSGDSSSVLKGGGQDLTRSVGQVKSGELPTEKRIINLKAAQAEVERLERRKLDELKGRLESAIEARALLRQFRRQLRIDMTPEGLRVQIVDEQNRPMFDSGSAILKDYARDILRELASLMNDLPNRVSLAGHTDAKPYAGGERGYSNWELSADRANASRRELVAGGIAEAKIVRVVGLAAAVPFVVDDPLAPSNRRISITVLKPRAEQQILDAASAAPALEAPEAIPAAEAPAHSETAPENAPPRTAPESAGTR